MSDYELERFKVVGDPTAASALSVISVFTAEELDDEYPLKLTAVPEAVDVSAAPLVFRGVMYTFRYTSYWSMPSPSVPTWEIEGMLLSATVRFFKLARFKQDSLLEVATFPGVDDPGSVAWQQIEWSI